MSDDDRTVPNEPDASAPPGDPKAWMHAPWDREAEESLVGAMLMSSDGIRGALASCSPEDLWSPELRSIAHAVVFLHQHGKPVDAVTVHEALIEPGGREPVSRSRLMELLAGTPLSANARAYGEIVAKYARFREAMNVGHELIEAGKNAEWDRLDKIANDVARRLAPAVIPIESYDLIDLWNLDVSERDDPSKPWVIPHCLRQGEVYALTGGEGGGKSMWLRQCAVCVASGVHPVTGISIGVEAQRVLFVDLQEDPVDMAGEVTKFKRAVQDTYAAGNYAAVAIPEGLDLLSSSGRRVMEGLLERHRPALVAIGPVVSMFRTPPGRRYDEDLIVELSWYWKEWMARFGFGLMLEGHAGNDRSNADDWRIRGSAVWRSWPAFSHGLKVVAQDPRREVEVIRARGDRYAERCWPHKLFGGTGWRLPWKSHSSDYDRTMRAMGLGYLLDGGDQEGLDLDAVIDQQQDQTAGEPF